MSTRAVIFDMDGLLIDSEPLWNEAADEVLQEFGLHLTPTQYATTRGLRTSEFVGWWFRHFQIDAQHQPAAETRIIEKVMQKVSTKGKALPGVHYIIDFFIEAGYKIGLATSSPQSLVSLVTRFLHIEEKLHAIATAEFLPYGKPHPQVYLDCAAVLGVSPLSCICFEDSFNGLIAAKAARMKCVLVPAPEQAGDRRWQAADAVLTTLEDFDQDLLQQLMP